MKTTDKILYSTKEGTSGFWGFEVPDVYLKWRNSEEPSYSKILNEAIESCKSNSLEIVNPMEIVYSVTAGVYAIKGEKKPLWTGDIFDLPSNYEFKEEETSPCTKARKCLDTTKNNDGTETECISRCKLQNKVLRLVPQPEPEESQNESEWTRFWYEFGENNFDMRNAHKYFTIQRKKQ